MGYHRIPVPIGCKYGMLTVKAESPKKILPSGQKIRVVECVCDCGNTHEVAVLHLVRGRIRSCGCIQKTKKGESNTSLHKRWKAMVDRCYADTNVRHIYKDRNITVCDAWHDFFVFKKWALQNGYKQHLQLDRINNDKGYSPSNCRFVTSSENCNNRRVTFYVSYKGEKVSFLLLLRKLGIPEIHHHTIRCRINRGWNHDKAVDTPIRTGNYATRHNPCNTAYGSVS